MKKSFFISIFLLLPILAFPAAGAFTISSSSSDSDPEIAIVPRSVAQIIMDAIPRTHKIRHGDMLVSWIRDVSPTSSRPLQSIFELLSKEYLGASERVFYDLGVGRFLPDSQILLEIVGEQATLFDQEESAELKVNLWELKRDFLRLALFYAQQAKESIPTKLTIHRGRADRHRNTVLAQCRDPYEAAPFDQKHHMIWKYDEPLRKDLAAFAAVEIGVYQRLLEKEELFNEFLIDLAYHMSNGTVLRAATKHFLDNLMQRYALLAEIWNDRYKAISLEKKFPLPHSLSKRKSTNENEYEKEVSGELKELTLQIKELQAIGFQLGECGNIFSAKLDKISGSNIALKASGTSKVVEGVMGFTEKYSALLNEIYLERFWRLVSLVGTLIHIDSPISIPDLDDILINAPHLTPAALKRISLDLVLVKARGDEIELRAIKELSPKTSPVTSRSLLRSLLHLPNSASDSK